MYPGQHSKLALPKYKSAALGIIQVRSIMPPCTRHLFLQVVDLNEENIKCGKHYTVNDFEPLKLNIKWAEP
jgi:hypothetical protein